MFVWYVVLSRCFLLHLSRLATTLPVYSQALAFIDITCRHLLVVDSCDECTPHIDTLFTTDTVTVLTRQTFIMKIPLWMPMENDIKTTDDWQYEKHKCQQYVISESIGIQ